VKTRRHIGSALVPALATIVLALVLAACGSTSATPSQSPSTIYPESSPTGTLPALKAYLSDAQDILGQVSTTVSTLPDAVGNLSAKPDDTWTAAATQLQSTATQLGTEASALAALQPPSALQPVQDAVVKGIEAAQTGVSELATKLESGQQQVATRKAQVQAEVDKYKTQIQSLADQLKGALGNLGQ
jgi:uncharacterized phage infection (PIP) family protein YhgE